MCRSFFFSSSSFSLPLSLSLLFLALGVFGGSRASQLCHRRGQGQTHHVLRQYPHLAMTICLFATLVGEPGFFSPSFFFLFNPPPPFFFSVLPVLARVERKCAKSVKKRGKSHDAYFAQQVAEGAERKGERQAVRQGRKGQVGKKSPKCMQHLSPAWTAPLASSVLGHAIVSLERRVLRGRYVLARPTIFACRSFHC